MFTHNHISSLYNNGPEKEVDYFLEKLAEAFRNSEVRHQISDIETI